VLNPTMMSGDAFFRWLEAEEGRHWDWMRAVGFLPQR
jgi:hypothetical protein